MRINTVLELVVSQTCILQQCVFRIVLKVVCVFVVLECFDASLVYSDNKT